jgi:hypothetical protein
MGSRRDSYGITVKHYFRKNLPDFVSDIAGDFFSVNPLLWKLRRQIDDRIEPILIDRNNDRSGLLEEI